MKGAERFRQNSLFFSDACLATFRMDSTDTVRKKPWKQNVVSVDVGLLGLLLQDISKLVFADAAEEGSHVVGFLDHPLQTGTTALISRVKTTEAMAETVHVAITLT
ncbi:hypothetical protein EYF80_033608 [Liparis tanakae]|uniref:Uncharacterized protein n=1 Tax=Liparis tanakae TaxID=230148 RepID=A0A4Z2GTS2_9TELE|nr:hypothetical protein EYF80_033608 [Liparis tanakae]